MDKFMKKILRQGTLVSLCESDEQLKESYRFEPEYIRVDEKGELNLEECVKNIYTISVMENSSGKICGYIEIADSDSRTPELGIDIDDKYRSKGYGSEAVGLIIEYCLENYDINYFVWRTSTKNAVSCAIAKKYGAVLIQENPLLPKSLFKEAIDMGVMSEEDLIFIYTYYIYPQK